MAPHLVRMPRDPHSDLDSPGLAGGPGPTPPGVGDNTPGAKAKEPGEPGAAEEQRQQGEVAERSAGTRAADVDQRAQERGPGHDKPGG